jgi:septal ring factor EnvC (AmiA/AmiB activator)
MLRLRAPITACLTAIIALSCVAGVTAQSLDNKIDAQKKQLEKIQSEINAHRKKSKALASEESNVMKQLSSLDKEMILSKKLLDSLDEREKLLSERIDSLRVGVAFEQRMLDYQRDKLARRLRQMYKRGPNYKWELMLASPDIQDAVRRYKFTRMVAERDARLIREVAARKSDLQSEQTELTAAMADVVTAAQEHEEEASKLKHSKKERVAVLSRIRNEQSKHAQAIEELNRAQEDLQNLIEQLEEKRLSSDDSFTPTGNFADMRGRLPKPVDGPITKKFGKNRHPKFGTVTFNNGVNIKAPAGAPVRAVATGKVEFVDWISGYGNCIILNHGRGYYTLYAHVAEIFVDPGQRVKAREVIAEVGDTGSLNGYECHFEIRKSKEALDPLKWFGN